MFLFFPLFFSLFLSLFFLLFSFFFLLTFNSFLFLFSFLLFFSFFFFFFLFFFFLRFTIFFLLMVFLHIFFLFGRRVFTLSLLFVRITPFPFSSWSGSTRPRNRPSNLSFIFFLRGGYWGDQITTNFQSIYLSFMHMNHSLLRLHIILVFYQTIIFSHLS